MYEKKLEYMIEVGRQIRNAQAALAITAGELKPLRKGAKYTLSFPEAEMKWEGDLKSLKDDAKYPFQEVYEYLNRRDSSLDLGVMIEKMDFDSSMPPPHNQRLLQPDFQFSDDPKVFSSEFRHVRWLFSHAKGKDPQIDFLAMRVLFHAGRMLERLKYEGKVKSDKQFERGARPSKKHVGSQAVYEAFHHVDWEGLKMIRIGELINSYLVDLEEKKPKFKRKKVYCADYIAKKILPKDKKIKEILLREGILKK